MKQFFLLHVGSEQILVEINFKSFHENNEDFIYAVFLAISFF